MSKLILLMHRQKWRIQDSKTNGCVWCQGEIPSHGARVELIMLPSCAFKATQIFFDGPSTRRTIGWEKEPALFIIIPSSIGAAKFQYTIFFMEQSALFFLFFMLMACTTTLVQCTNKSIFILSGQSNMIGEGGVTSGVWNGIVPRECQSNPQILRLNNAFEWEVAREPLHKGIGQVQDCGVGPGMAFANSVVKPGEVIGLVPFAVGATHIDQWQRGTSNYNQTVTRARASVSNGIGVIRAVLWYQGESDTYTPLFADSYKGKLVRFFNDLRNDLHAPSLPIIQVGLVNGGIYIDIVREAQLNAGLPNVYCVDARKLNVTIQKNDTFNVHLDTPSQVKLGKALATVFRNISALV